MFSGKESYKGVSEESSGESNISPLATLVKFITSVWAQFIFP